MKTNREVILENRVRELEVVIESKYKEGDLVFAESLYQQIENQQQINDRLWLKIVNPDDRGLIVRPQYLVITRKEIVLNIAKEVAIYKASMQLKMASFEVMNDLMERIDKIAGIVIKIFSWPYQRFQRLWR